MYSYNVSLGKTLSFKNSLYQKFLYKISQYKTSFYKILCLLLALSVCTQCTPAGKSGVKPTINNKGLTKGVTIPNATSVAYYIPQNLLDDRFYVASGSFWAEPGKGLQEGSKAVFDAYFTSAMAVDLKSEKTFSLLIDMDPEWDVAAGNVTLKIKYRVLDATYQVIKEGEKSHSAAFDFGLGAAFYNVSLKVTQMALMDILNELKPQPGKYPSVKALNAIDPAQIADSSKPISSGTGFFINATGQVVTASHVLDSCLITKVIASGKESNATMLAESKLLDLAVLNTQKPSLKFLPFRVNHNIGLGEAVTSVGYPLKGLLEDTPNLTKGNVSSYSGLKGSLGVFQFSAPIQPGVSGGPIVSDGGELLGITVSTLNAKFLIEKGVLPQNVNFGLNAKYLAMFLKKNNIAYTEVKANDKASAQTGNESALSSVVQIGCYQ